MKGGETTRSIRLDAVLVQAVIAGALSFAHLHDIAAAAGQTGWKAWAYPISVDLLLVAAWRRIRTLRAAEASARVAWCWFSIALVASLGANVATAGLLNLQAVPAWLRILVAGWPALAFFGGTLLAHTTPPETKESAASAPAPVQEVTEPAPALTVERPELPDRVPEMEPAPVTASAPAESADMPAPAAMPSVPPALVEHARKLADTHRSQTGEPIGTDTLRARLGVPAPLAEAIATQLVFTTRYGTPIEPRNFNRSFDARSAKAGVRKIRLHDTRHTCGSLLAALDVHPRIAMQILRHSKIAITMEVYTHIPSEATRKALRKLGKHLGGPANDQGQSP